MTSRVDRLFDVSKDAKEATAEILLPAGNEAKFHALLQALETHSRDLKCCLSRPNAIDHAKQYINDLVRLFGKHIIEANTKENAYVFYVFLLNLWNDFEGIYRTQLESLRREDYDSLRLQLAQINSAATPELEAKFCAVERGYSEEAAKLREQLRVESDKVRVLEKTVLHLREDLDRGHPAAELSPVMLNLEDAYSRVKDSLNEVYDQKLS